MSNTNPWAKPAFNKILGDEEHFPALTTENLQKLPVGPKVGLKSS